MASIRQLPSGNWQVQIGRKGRVAVEIPQTDLFAVCFASASRRLLPFGDEAEYGPDRAFYRRVECLKVFQQTGARARNCPACNLVGNACRGRRQIWAGGCKNRWLRCLNCAMRCTNCKTSGISRYGRFSKSGPNSELFEKHDRAQNYTLMGAHGAAPSLDSLNGPGVRTLH